MPVKARNNSRTNPRQRIIYRKRIVPLSTGAACTARLTEGSAGRPFPSPQPRPPHIGVQLARSKLKQDSQHKEREIHEKTHTISVAIVPGTWMPGHDRSAGKIGRDASASQSP